jgi:Tfp pilus assembly protein PilP
MRRALHATGVLLALAGCGGDAEIVTGAPPSWVMPQAPATPSPGESEADVDAGPQAIKYDDSDFVEVETQNRDPFRSFTGAFKREAVEIGRSQRAVVMADTPVDDMRLIAIVLRGGTPFAMLTDKQGVGHVVKPREYLGRPEVLQVGTEQTLPVQINWQVYRIRDREVVLRREDPANPDAPPITRVIVMQDDTHDGQPETLPTGTGMDLGLDEQARRALETIRSGRGYR